jgi:hypothetical protein
VRVWSFVSHLVYERVIRAKNRVLRGLLLRKKEQAGER